MHAGMTTSFPSNGIVIVGFRDPDEDDEPPLTHLARISKSRLRITTFERRITLEDFEEFDPLMLNELREELPAQLRRYLQPGPIPPRTWEETRSVLARLRPETEPAIARLEGRADTTWMQGRRREIVVLEADAVTMALRISGIARGVNWRQPLTPAPFLRGLENVRVGEENVLDRDMHVFGNWSELESDFIGAAEFENRGRRLTIVNVNRRPLEKTLGADLIYYSHDLDAFVLVQYKMLEREKGHLRFRPNAQFEKELQRLRQIPEADWNGTPNGYRLNAAALYLKFCTREPPRIGRAPAPGLYLPLQLWDSLHAAGELRGPRGGAVLDPAALPRHLTNTDFENLVGSGWIGSRGDVTKQVNDLVRAGLEAGRSQILAAESGPSLDNVDEDDRDLVDEA